MNKFLKTRLINNITIKHILFVYITEENPTNWHFQKV